MFLLSLQENNPRNKQNQFYTLERRLSIFAVNRKDSERCANNQLCNDFSHTMKNRQLKLVKLTRAHIKQTVTSHTLFNVHAKT